MPSDATGRTLRAFAALLTVVFAALLIAAAPARAADEADPHAALLSESSYPTAGQCGACHGQIYNEWASSNHAYASISPMFHKFEQTINDLSSGTIGSFCVRCHQQVGTQRGEERWRPLWERSEVAREGAGDGVAESRQALRRPDELLPARPPRVG